MAPTRTVVLDTETTGFSPASGDRLVELAMVELANGAPTGRRMHSLYWPQRQVPDRAAQVHGWTTAKLRGKPLFSSQAQAVADFLDGAEGWAHNAAFDARFLNAELERAGILRHYPLSCSCKLAKKVLPGQPNYKLDTLARWAGHTWTGRAHGAMADTLALVDVLGKLWTTQPAPRAPARVQAPARAATPTPSASPLPAWTGPVAPGNDPRIQPISTPHSLPRQGARWNAEEDALLRATFLDGANLRELVAAMGRSPGALVLRLAHQGLVAPDHPYAHMARRA